MTVKSIAERIKVVSQVLPQDINGAAQGGNYNFVSLRNYQGAYFQLNVGAHSGAAVTFSVNQAKNVEGNGSKALSFDKAYQNTPGSSPQEESDRWDQVTGLVGSLTIAANTKYLIPVRTGELDVTNDFDCIRGELTAGAASTLVSMDLVLHDGPMGITGDVRHIPSGAVNRMPN